MYVIVATVISLSLLLVVAVTGGVTFAIGRSVNSSGSSGQPNASFVLVNTLIESTIVTPPESVLGPTGNIVKQNLVKQNIV